MSSYEGNQPWEMERDAEDEGRYDDHQSGNLRRYRPMAYSPDFRRAASPSSNHRYRPYSPVRRSRGSLTSRYMGEESLLANVPRSLPREAYPRSKDGFVASSIEDQEYDVEEEDRAYSPRANQVDQSDIANSPGHNNHSLRSLSPRRPGTGAYNLSATPLITGIPLIPGRFSGFGNPPPPKVNKMPEFISADNVSDAALLKRGLQRSGEARVASRAIGATDPDNIMIISMFDNDKMTWIEIAQRMNQQRIMKGAKPNFTANSCHNRYNRNAPILYATDGREWVPVNKRRNYRKGVHVEQEVQETDHEVEGRSNDEGDPSPLTRYNDNIDVDQFTWDSQCDLALVQARKRIDAQLWPSVAKVFHEITGLKVSPTIAANRFALI